ncbi:PIN domain-containing protein [Raoultella planticola]|uniref:PIN domain-containing protein n=1 Tax=Raoultella planticola TaxID=575 RepID=UPI001F40FCFC|nr:PIN domain-containing protein [Raoultella planticola]MCE9856964.1 PIN domain-containing protein [Raoultella planticola]
MPLVTRNVFIDTEFFVKANLDFNSRTIKSFEELCEKNEFKHITSTIVVKEVERKVIEHIKEALKGINNFRRKAVVLKEYDDDNIKNLFCEINEADIQEKASSAFNSFIETSKATIVDMSEVNLNEVIDMYFNKASPFSTKKPNEFRDAFTLLAIRSALKEGEKIYVISEDPDLKDFCEKNDQFLIIETLSVLLDDYNKHNDERTDFIKRFLSLKNKEINQILIEELESAEAYNYSTWEDSEIENFKVMDISEFEPKIIHLDDGNCQITFDITVKFSVKASGPDTANGYYDKEDGVLHTFDSTFNQEEEEKEFSVELDLSFEIDGDRFINDNFSLYIKGLGAGIEFDVEENSWEDYR